MEKKQWSMQEDFYFPEHAGVPTGVQSVTVTPRYTEERTEDAVRLTGIYHIAANVEFDEGPLGRGNGMIHLSSLTMSKWMAKMVILNTRYR